jgi:hypothetical protein
MKTLVLLMALAAAAAASDGFRRNSVTVSTGIPGILIPELTWEYAFTPKHRISAGLGTIWIIPVGRLSYVRIAGGFELTGSVGSIGSLNEENFNLLSSDNPLYFVSATGGYRKTFSSGFIFRAAGGGALFMGDDKTQPVPFGQVGVGYSF